MLAVGLAVGSRCGGLSLHERPVALHLMVPHGEEHGNDEDPVHVVGNDRAVRGRVSPAQNGIEEAPTATAVQLRAAALGVCQRLAEKSAWEVFGTYVDMPNGLVDVVRSRTVS